MFRLQTVAMASIVSAALIASASAQAPPASKSQASPTARGTQAGGPATKQAQRTPARGTQGTNNRRSIVHHYPYPYPGYYHSDQRAGWRNPGGIGRYGEYYPAGGQFQLEQAAERDPVRVATFGDGGIPTRQEQLQAQQIGIQRENAIMNHIDNYARPYYGYGFGVGYFGGFY
jgi:hypothetical protein